MKVTAIEVAQRTNRERRKGGEVIKPNHNLLQKFRNKPGKTLAIHAACFECYGGTDEELPDRGWKNLIATCTRPNCPLYDYRPYKKVLTDDESDVENNAD